MVVVPMGYTQKPCECWALQWYEIDDGNERKRALYTTAIKKKKKKEGISGWDWAGIFCVFLKISKWIDELWRCIFVEGTTCR